MITEKGIKIRDEVDIFDSIVNDFATEFPNMSKESNNALIVLARILSREISNNENNRLEAYNNAYVTSAIGTHLDKAVQTVGLTRIHGTNSYGVCTFKKDPKFSKITIPPNTQIESGELQFVTINNSFVTIFGESADIEVRSLYAGKEYNLPQQSKFNTVIDIRGLKEITNAKEFSGGTNTETDQMLRNRYYNFINAFSNASLNGIISEMSKLEDVTRVSGRENNTDSPVAGLPPHSFELYIEGSTPSIIAEKIFSIKPAGIKTHGDISQTISYAGNDYEIKFSKFDKNNVYYNIEIKTAIGVSTSDIEEKIKQSLITYTSSSKTINHSNIVGALYNSVDGISAITKLKFGLTPNPQADDEITASIGTIFFTDETKIEVSFALRN